MADSRGDPGEVYFEFTAIGPQVKVAAVHAATGIEVAVMAPAGAARHDLERLALRKLKMRLERQD